MRYQRLKFIVFVLAACLSWGGKPGAAQGMLDVQTSVDGIAAPARILAMTPGTQNYRADRKQGWGSFDVPTGMYEVMVVPAGPNAVPVRFPSVSVAAGETTRVLLDTAITLQNPGGLPPLEQWYVTGAEDDRIIAGASGRYGPVLVPAGRYRIQIPIAGGPAQSDVIDVVAGTVAQVDMADTGLGFVSFGMPDDSVIFGFGADRAIPILEMDGERFNLASEVSDNAVPLWLRAGEIVLERRAGRFTDRRQVQVTAGQRIDLPFDLSHVLREKWFSAVRLPEALPEGDPRLTVSAAHGERALRVDPAPKPDHLYILPGGADLRVAVDGQTRLRQGLAPGGTSEMLSVDADVPPEIVPSLAIERPAPVAELPNTARMVQVVGRASATGQAGPTRIMLVVDTSGSTEEPAGADLDGDGAVDSILAAEKAAIRRLLLALAEVDRASLSSAFDIGLVAFGDTAQLIMPPLPVGGDGTMDRLLQAVDGLEAGATGGSTFYGRALDLARRALERQAAPWPQVILLVTDGKPSQILPAYDAAARLGHAGIVLHTVGLGADFGGVLPARVAFPSETEQTGPGILSIMAAFGADGSQAWALPRPADIVALIPDLPILNAEDAGIASVTLRNETLSQNAVSVDLQPDGSFAAEVPVEFGTENAGLINTLLVSATARSGGRTADAQVRLLSADASGEVPERPDPEELQALEDQLAAMTERLAAAQAQARDAGAAEAQARAEIARLRSEAAAAQDRGAVTAAEMQAELKDVRAMLVAARGGAQQCADARASCQADLSDALAQLLNPTPVEDGIVLTVPGDVLFDFGAVDIRPDAATSLGLASRFIADFERSDIVVEGHTDAVGSEALNAKLSLDRAQAVADWLIGNGEIDADRISIDGFGESRPVSEETQANGADWPEGRQRNRRVEIRILK